MKKLWMRWIALALFVALLGVLFIRLGEWQLHRLEQRREANARVEAYQKADPVDWKEAFNKPITENDQWRKVKVTGTFTTTNFRVLYRQVGDTPGNEVVTVFKPTDGPAILVSRGLIPRKIAGDSETLPTTSGEVTTIIGYVRRDQVGKANAVTPVNGNIRLINSREIAKTLDYPLVDGYLQVIEMTPGDVPEMVLIGPPTLDEGPHLSYAVQWFIFTLIAVGGATMLIRGDLREKRKSEAKAAKLAAQTATEEAPDGPAPE